jgi:two-component system, sensor histidine kinase PdtaS
MSLMKAGATCSYRALAVSLDPSQVQASRMPSAAFTAVTLCVTAAALLLVLACGSQAPALLATAAIAAIAAASTAGLAICSIRLAAERDEAVKARLDGEARLAEAQHRIGNNLTVISAMLSVQSRQLGDPGARRAIEQAAGRLRVISDINHVLNHLTSTNVRIDDILVRGLVGKSIDAAGAESRVRYETSIDPIHLPKLLLTPLALLLNECVTSALEHDFPGAARGVITIRLAAQNQEQGVRRLTIAASGSDRSTDLESCAARNAGLAFMNAFALQLDGSFRLEPADGGRRAVVIF